MTGAKAYLRTPFKIFSKVKMSEIDTIFSKVSSAIVIINEDQRAKRVKQLEALNCKIVSERHTGLNELSLYVLTA
jgi:hypothetical protein